MDTMLVTCKYCKTVRDRSSVSVVLPLAQPLAAVALRGPGTRVAQMSESLSVLQWGSKSESLSRTLSLAAKLGIRPSASSNGETKIGSKNYDKP